MVGVRIGGKGVSMSTSEKIVHDLVKRFGKSISGQQRGLVAEFKKAKGGSPKLLTWEREVVYFKGGDNSLGGEAWGKLQDWWKKKQTSN